MQDKPFFFQLAIFCLLLVVLLGIVSLWIEIQRIKPFVSSSVSPQIPFSRPAASWQAPEVRRYTIQISEQGFSPAGFIVEAGKEVELNLENLTESPRTFILEDFDIEEEIQPFEQKEVSFRIPEKDFDEAYPFSSQEFQGEIRVFSPEK